MNPQDIERRLERARKRYQHHLLPYSGYPVGNTNPRLRGRHVRKSWGSRLLDWTATPHWLAPVIGTIVGTLICLGILAAIGLIA
jgi:hypothetical protein